MRKHRVVLVVACTGVLWLSSAQAASTKTMHSVKNARHKPLFYKAECGMIYTAAQAKKNHYLCPMDHQKMTPLLLGAAKKKTS